MLYTYFFYKQMLGVCREGLVIETQTRPEKHLIEAPTTRLEVDNAHIAAQKKRGMLQG
jgi:hypothetical protein